MRILLLEQDEVLPRAVKERLEQDRVEIDIVSELSQANSRARAGSYDAIVLGTPPRGSCTLLRDWRRDGIETPILMLVDALEDGLLALAKGADAYLSKPFDDEELPAWLNALTRRNRSTEQPVLRVHDLEIDFAGCTVKRAGKLIPLTPREFALLRVLASRPGKIVTRSRIWKSVFNQPRKTSNAVDVYIRGLRSKIDRGFELPLILTRWGYGYMLREEAG